MTITGVAAMHTDVHRQIDLETIKRMAQEAEKKASEHQGTRVEGTSTFVISYSIDKKSFEKELQKIRSFFEENKE